MKILLHICCGICAGSVAEKLIAEGHELTGYFYNPNLYPEEEHQKRLDVARSVCNWLNISLLGGKYDHESWSAFVKGLENEPEGGSRCAICYRVRLQNACVAMRENGCDAFTTTLTVSPHKPAAIVNRIGQEIGGDKFLSRDFKKQDGFKRANEIAKKLDVYRQHYCGCSFSLNHPPHTH